jgi:hypothetical protein
VRIVSASSRQFDHRSVVTAPCESLRGGGVATHRFRPGANAGGNGREVHAGDRPFATPALQRVVAIGIAVNGEEMDASRSGTVRDLQGPGDRGDAGHQVRALASEPPRHDRPVRVARHEHALTVDGQFGGQLLDEGREESDIVDPLPDGLSAAAAAVPCPLDAIREDGDEALVLGEILELRSGSELLAGPKPPWGLTTSGAGSRAATARGT